MLSKISQPNHRFENLIFYWRFNDRQTAPGIHWVFWVQTKWKYWCQRFDCHTSHRSTWSWRTPLSSGVNFYPHQTEGTQRRTDSSVAARRTRPPKTNWPAPPLPIFDPTDGFLLLRGAKEDASLAVVLRAERFYFFWFLIAGVIVWASMLGSVWTNKGSSVGGLVINTQT